MADESQQPVVTMGVAGGSGAGKSTAARIILDRLGEERIAFVPHDAYYRDLADLPEEQRRTINFDHPDSLDSDLFVQHVQQLQQGQPVDVPIYDFTTDSRTDETRRILPQRVVLVEGVLIFTEARMRKLFDMRIFIETDHDLRFIRRLQRDIAERGRTTDSVIAQWLATVRPMHMEFVEPSKRYAHVIIPEGGLNEVAIEMVIARLESLLEQ